MPTISVIVPVYKVEPYLRRCVDSILDQTYSDFELILVDDGSPDNCPDICDDYARQDSRVKVIHKENGGLSDARNAGLRIAAGAYVSFVDSDDFIRKDMYEVMLAELICADADFIKSDFCTFSDVSQIDLNPTEYHVQVYSPLEALRDFMETPYTNQKHMKSTVCDGLYKRELFVTGGAVSLEFPVGKINEDTYTFPELIFRSNRIAHINEAFYFYYIREGGITHTKVNLREINSCDLWEHVYRVVRQHTDAYARIIACNSISRYLNVLRRTYDSEYRRPYFAQIRTRLLLDQERLIPHVDDVRMKRTLRLIRVYPVYLMMKHFGGRFLY